VPVTISFEETAESLITSCLTTLTELEADYVRKYYLQQPKMTLTEFRNAAGLSAKSFNGLRQSAISKLKNSLAEKNVHSMTDIL
jgi:DNA-directed RNA polymerase sigma subunit (sigma70/sigma32)